MRTYKLGMIIAAKLRGGRPLLGRTWAKCFTYEPKWGLVILWYRVERTTKMEYRTIE
jgi:hypothetical protein